MHKSNHRRTILTSTCIAAVALLIAVNCLPCPGADALPQNVRSAIDKVRDRRANLYDSFESSTLGKIASPAEIASTQKNMREYYMTPGARLELTEARKKQLGELYGRVTLFGRPRTGKSFALGITGAQVIDIQARPELIVTRVTPQTPAASALKEDDVIIGANQRLFPEWEDPRVPIGYAIAAAQTKAFGGTLTLHIGRNGKFLTVKMKLPVDDGYGKNWPFDCKKSKAVADAAVDYILSCGDDTFWRDLFLMGVGDENAIAHVRDNLRKAQRTGRIGSNWSGGYKLLSLTEYYLLTGDKKVLPAIECHVRGLEANQMLCGGWSHGAPGGYGVMNQVGQICFMGLVLARECGVAVDQTVLTRAVGLSGRFIGTYGAYGDHSPGIAKYGRGAPFDNGIVPAHATLFSLLGEPDVARRSGRRSCYLYRTRMGGHAERIFTIGWSSVGAAFAPEPEFRMYADNMIWYHELARQRNGALIFPGYTRYRRSTAATGMIYALPQKRLRITGAPRGTKPLFPIATLEAVKAEPPTAPPAVRGKPKTASLAAPQIWDTLLAKDAGNYRCLAAGKLKPDKQSAWYHKDYDDGKWEATKTQPKIGQSPQGILLRTKFLSSQTGYTNLRVTLPIGVGGEIFLNGDRVAAFAKGGQVRGGPAAQTLDLGARALSALRRGSNLLAARLEGSANISVSIDLAAGPSKVDKRAVPACTANYGNNNRNGWVGSYEQHRRSVAWFFEGKSAREIARYLAFPDWMGAQATCTALAEKGAEAVPLITKLVADSHAGIRVGAWDAAGVMNARGLLSVETKQSLAALAASRVAKEDPVVGEAMGRAAAPMAKGEALAKILSGIAAKPDIKSREFAVSNAVQGLKNRPDLMIGVLRIVAASRLEQNTIRVLGGSMSGMSRNAHVPEARAGVKEIARVLDEVSPDMRGMFTDGLMHGGLAVIDQHLDAELEKTPHLVAGLTKCFTKVPDTDWPGWAFANLYLRRQIYRLGAASARKIRGTVDAMLAVPDQARGEAVRRPEPIAELKAWAATLERTKGKDDALRTEAIRMADSKDPAERLVALSLVWPSQRTLAGQSARYHGRHKLADVARFQDPATRLAVAVKAATHTDTNLPTHWLLIWQTVAACQDSPQYKSALPPLGEFFDTVAWRQRGTFMFRAIDIAATLAKPQLGTPGETHLLARGICKTYATSSNNGWYVATTRELHGLVKALGKSSGPAIREAIAAEQAWLKKAPPAEKAAVIGRWCPPQDIRKRLEELTAIAALLAKP